MGTALQNIFAMYCIMMGTYFLKKRSPYPVGVVNNLVFNFFLPVTVFYSIREEGGEEELFSSVYVRFSSETSTVDCPQYEEYQGKGNRLCLL
jgi:predicted permease